jgi:hypothetical protein
MGQVWRAHDSQTNRVVALKVLPARSADDEELRERFRRECRAVAQLTEPHVIPIHDFGDIDGRLFLNMRLIEGTDLRSVILREGALTPKRAVAIITQVAGALQAAHDAGLVHRDVKPSNILLGADDFAYLIDFGIARAADDASLTQAGQTIGTLNYMAPEAIGAAVKTDARVDVYALACVLYESLTGRPPFSSTSGIPGLINEHLYTPPPQPSLGRPNIPAAFDAVVAKGMAKDPDERYQSTRELAAAARTAVGDSAVTIVESGVGRGGRPIKLSRKAIGLLAAAVVVTVVAAVAVTAWIWHPFGSAERKTSPITAAAPPAPANPNNLNADEIDLLKHAWTNSYNRASCRGVDAGGLAKATIVCAPNPSTGAPLANFYSFTSPDQLHKFFSTYTKLVNATSCPGDPPGPDGPAKDLDGKEVGRRACYLNKLANRRDPVPSTTVTHESTPVMADFQWIGSDGAEGPGGADGLDSFVYGLGGTDGDLPDHPSDPDFFTSADLDLLSLFSRTLGSQSGYTTTNCRHLDTTTSTKAELSCGSNPVTGYPNVYVFRYDDLGALRSSFDLTQRQRGAGCGAGHTNEAWFVNGHDVGRYTCLTDAATFRQPTPAILATNEDQLWLAEFSADRSGYPYPTPRNQQELLDWFKKVNG